MLPRLAYVTLAATLSFSGVQGVVLPGGRGSFLEPLQEVLSQDGVRHKPCTDKENGNYSIAVSPADEIRKKVEKDFLSKMDRTVYPKMGEKSQFWTVTKSKYPGRDYNQMDITAYKPETCHPVIHDATSLAPGIYCTTSGGCEFKRSLTTSKSYENTAGAEITVTSGGGVNVEVFSAHVEVSASAKYEHKWINGDSTTNEYTFTLQKGESCIPSMVHVELECDVVPVQYVWDNYVRQYVPLRPEDVLNRRGGRWDNGQHCTKVETSLNVDLSDDWKQLLKNDIWRGHAWSSDPKRFVGGSNKFNDRTLIIRRNDGDAGDVNVLFFCDPSGETQSMKALVPYNEKGSLPGYVACLAY